MNNQSTQSWQDRFDEKFTQDKSGEKVEGYLLYHTGIMNNIPMVKIAIPNDVKSFISSELEAQKERIGNSIIKIVTDNGNETEVAIINDLLNYADHLITKQEIK